MSLFQPVGQVQNIARSLQKGDTQTDGSVITVVTGATGQTVSGAALASGIITRTGTLGGAANDTFPSAADIIAAVSSEDKRPSNNTQWRLRYINVATGQTITILAGTGVTLTGTMTIATATWREFLIELRSTLLPQIIGGNTTNGSAIVQLVNTDNHRNGAPLIEPGMLVTGTGIPASTTVLGVTPEGVITLSANATATGSNVALTFNPTVVITNIGGGTA